MPRKKKNTKVLLSQALINKFLDLAEKKNSLNYLMNYLSIDSAPSFMQFENDERRACSMNMIVTDSLALQTDCGTDLLNRLGLSLSEDPGLPS